MELILRGAKMKKLNPQLTAVRDARLGLKLAELTFKRALIDAAKAGEAQRAIGHAAAISQPAVAQHLAHSGHVRPVPQGFSGADPLEICQRYYLGQITEDRLFDELTRWEYIPDPEPEHLLDEGASISGTWNDVLVATNMDYISEEQYARLFDMMEDDRPH